MYQSLKERKVVNNYDNRSILTRNLYSCKGFIFCILVNLTVKYGLTVLWLGIKGNEDAQIIKEIENAGLDMNYDVSWKRYNIKSNNFEEYKANKELIDSMIKNVLEYFNID